MRIIRVKAAPGRVAYSAPAGGRLIPQDEPIAIPLTPWVEKLIAVHGDVIVVDGPAAGETTAPVKKAHKAG